MGDETYYPDNWKAYQIAVKKKKIIGTPEWGRFAARYRAAGNYSGSSFFYLSSSVADGYSWIIKLVLAYCAFESACNAADLKPNQYRISSDRGFYKEIAIKLRAEYGRSNEANFPLRNALGNKNLAAKIERFLDGRDGNLQPIAAALRHLFVHGIWTPTGGEAISARAQSALDLLSQRLLHAGDEILNAYLASAGIVDKGGKLARKFKNNSTEPSSVFEPANFKK